MSRARQLAPRLHHRETLLQQARHPQVHLLAAGRPLRPLVCKWSAACLALNHDRDVERASVRGDELNLAVDPVIYRPVVPQVAHIVYAPRDDCTPPSPISVRGVTFFRLGGTASPRSCDLQHPCRGTMARSAGARDRLRKSLHAYPRLWKGTRPWLTARKSSSSAPGSRVPARRSTWRHMESA